MMPTERMLAEIFNVVLDLPPESNVEKIRRISEPRWDSLAHVSLIAAIESEFKLTLNVADRERITSYGAAILLLREKGSIA